MRASLLGIGLVLAGVALAPTAEAQESPQPGTIVVSYFKCSFADLDEAVAMINAEPREVAQALVAEGRLIDHGILTHAWGDEWNLIQYFVAADLESFHAAWGEWARRMDEQDPDGEMSDRFFGLCPEHKDNIYDVVGPPDGM
ncbi:MAG TPA: hypothetical protein VM737_02305 [Gemmatimonadota bacterium]|nr:hypothetical protein [Gemmatimonadota bacterium]